MLAIGGSACLVTRSGYTGEDGFEISVAGSEAERLARLLLDDASVTPVGLGARDSLRTEAGLCLYGADIDEQHDAGRSGAGMGDAESPPARRRARRRVPGADAISRELGVGPRRRRAGLRSLIERRFAAAPCCLPGVPRPSPSARSHPAASDLRRPVRSPWVMCRTRSRRPGRTLFAEVRGNRVPVEVTDLPFVPHRYKRTN